MSWFHGNNPILKDAFSTFTKRADTFNKNNQCRMMLGSLSSACAKLEPVNYKNNEMQEINVWQKFNLLPMLFWYHVCLAEINSPAQPKEQSRKLELGKRSSFV